MYPLADPPVKLIFNINMNITKSVTGIISLKIKIDHPFTNKSVHFTHDR